MRRLYAAVVAGVAVGLADLQPDPGVQDSGSYRPRSGVLRGGTLVGPAIAVRVFNDSGHTIRVEAIGLRRSGGERLRAKHLPGGQIPGRVAPRDSARVYISRDQIESQ